MRKRTDDAPDKLFRLLKAKDLEGLREGELKRTLKLTAEEAGERAQALEADGKAVILSFSPLYLLSKESLQFLEGKILKYIEQHHLKHPDELGVSLARLEKRFDVPKKVMNLALKGLTRGGKIRESGKAFQAADFKPTLNAAEKEWLAELEQVSLRGELDAAAIKSVQSRHRVSPARIEKLLALLVERKSVVQGRDSFYVNSVWLDELVAKLKARESREFTVAEFKEMTGLSRKYSIPLLELLDEMGVTRRKGNSREIL
jgi:selenocysteine-specific elongation factor